jgi:O-antigen/teichoic acid export membrane protein
LSASLIYKGVIVLLIVLIFLSLTGALVFLVQDKGKTKRTVTSLTVRVVLSMLLIILLVVGVATGLIEPHGFPPK